MTILKTLDTDGSIMFKWTLMEFNECGLDSSGLGKGPVVGSFEHSNEPLDP